MSPDECVGDYHCIHCKQDMVKASMATHDMCWGCSSSFKMEEDELCRSIDDGVCSRVKQVKKNIRNIKKKKRKAASKARKKNR